MTSKSLNIIMADTVRGIFLCLLPVLYRLTLPRVSLGPDLISVSLRPLFPGTDILQGASGGVCCHYEDQVMSQLFHSSCSFIQQPIREMLRGEGICLTCQVWFFHLNVDWSRQAEGHLAYVLHTGIMRPEKLSVVKMSEEIILKSLKVGRLT